MPAKIRPGLFFRIRDTSLNRAKGLSPHTSKGHIVFLDEDFFSVSINNGRFPERIVYGKVTIEQFHYHFSIDVFTPSDDLLVKSRHFSTFLFD